MDDQTDLMSLECVALHDETPTTRTFRLRPSGPVEFEPGQALALRVPLPAGDVWRSFTISARTATGDLEVSIKAQAAGGATRWLHDAFGCGHRIAARRPRGRFTLGLRRRDALAFVSGGSGATPMLAMLSALADRDPLADVVWFHAARDPAEVMFPRPLTELQQRMPNLRVIITVTHPAPGWFGLAGRPNRALVAATIPDFARRQVFCCGPAGFMTALRLIYTAEGGDKALFHTESFGGAVPVATDLPADTDVQDDTVYRLTVAGRDIGIRPGESVLQASLRQGVIIPCGCGEGMCGTCIVRLNSGEVATNPQGGISDEEAAQGMILACSSRALGDIAITL